MRSNDHFVGGLSKRYHSKPRRLYREELFLFSEFYGLRVEFELKYRKKFTSYFLIYNGCYCERRNLQMRHVYIVDAHTTWDKKEERYRLTLLQFSLALEFLADLT